MSKQIDFDETVSYWLAKVTTSFRGALEKHLQGVHLHSGQVFMLLELWEKDGMRQIDLANRLKIAPATVSKTLTGLINKNLVRKDETDGDARSSRIHLTEEGRFARNRVESAWLDVESECNAVLDEVDRLIFIKLLMKMRKAFTGDVSEDDDE